MRERIYLTGVRHLAFWAFIHRDQPAYREALKNALDGLPKPNLREEHSSDLSDTLSLIDLSVTLEGRRKLGVKEDDMPRFERVMPLLMSRSRAKANIVKAERTIWTALGRPAKERDRLVSDADAEVNMSLLAFPTAASLYEAFGSGDDLVQMRGPIWEAGRQQYLGLLRALDGPITPRAIETKDLLSPFDGKPLKYKFDGRQIVIEVSGYVTNATPSLLKIPSDRIFKK